MKLTHFTDTHLVAPGERLYGLDPMQRLSALIDHASTHHSDADCAVITGDLTHWGDLAAYRALKKEIGRLPYPVHLVIGNHDDRAAFQQAFPETPRDPQGLVQYTVDAPAGRLVIAETVRKGTDAGWYDADRRAWLTQVLDEAQDRPIYLFLHHPPFAVHMPGMDAIAIEQSEEFAAVLEGRPEHPSHARLTDLLASLLVGLVADDQE